jgi:hypothetical protein
MATNSIGQSAFQLAYEYSPILLTGGKLGSFIPVPITVITEALDIPGIQNGEFFAHFKPLPGSTLADWQVAEYPFANMTIAANAVVQNPLKISMLMVCPAQTDGGYILKQAQLTLLQTVIQNHIQAAGTFTVITPAYTYTNCLLTSLRDVTNPSDKQVQFMYQWDFVQPLITSSGAASVLGNLMQKVTSGVPVTLAY